MENVRTVYIVEETTPEFSEYLFHKCSTGTIEEVYCYNYKRDVKIDSEDVIQISLERCNHCEKCLGKEPESYLDPLQRLDRKVEFKN